VRGEGEGEKEQEKKKEKEKEKERRRGREGEEGTKNALRKNLTNGHKLCAKSKSKSSNSTPIGSYANLTSPSNINVLFLRFIALLLQNSREQGDGAL
jgi:hypothetical protein